MRPRKIDEFTGKGLNTLEFQWGKKRFKDYQETFPHIKDYKLLEELVFLEALQERLKGKVEQIDATKDGEAGAVPRYLQDSLSKNLEQIMMVKEQLGLFESKDKLDAFSDIDATHEKFAEWRKQNQGSRKVTCPFCKEVFFLKIRTDKYEEFKFPFFQDKVLCNPHLHKIYKDNRITKEEYAQVLGVSPDYIDWLDEKWFQKVSQLPESK